MSRRAVLVLVLASLVVAPACDRHETPETSSRELASAEAGSRSRIGSCDRVPTMSVCSEYAGAYLAHDEPVLTANCSKLSGTFVYAECPNTAVLGACTLATGEVRKFYASGAAAYDVARAQRECEASYRGSWKPFP